MPVPVTQIGKVLNGTGELIYDFADDAMGVGCSTYEVSKEAGDRVLVCCEGVHTNLDPEDGPFYPINSVKAFCAHGNRITKVWGKAETSSTTIDAGPLSRNSPFA